MKLLNIIITAKFESKSLSNTLDSILRLKDIKKDILVTVVGNVKKDLVKRFFNDAQIIDNRRGLGNNYNDAINNKTTYVTFANSGDQFTNGLISVVELLKEKEPDILRTVLTERYISVDGKLNLGTVNYLYVETLRAHFIKRDFLINGYLFNNDLDIYSELNLYKKIALKNDMLMVNVNTLISSFSMVSLGQNEFPINISNFDEYYNALVDVMDSLRDNDNYKYYALNVIIALYMALESDKFLSPILKDKKREFDKLVYNLYENNKDIVDSIPENIKNNTLNIEYQKQKRLDINIKIRCPFDVYLEQQRMKFKNDEEERFLDVIVPEYNGEEFIFRMLDSLANQKSVDFNQVGVIIVNDCSPNRIKEYKFSRYGNLNIKYLINEKNVGQGPTRQNGVDNSKAKYVCFMDQDDMFNPEDDLALSKILSHLKTENPNCLIGNVVEEIKTMTGIAKKVNKSTDPLVYVHGLFLKRQYLIDNNYRFNPNLRQLEDTYFTRCLYLTGEDIRNVDIDIYLWKSNEKSQVRQKHDIAFNARYIDCFFIYLVDVTTFLEGKKCESTARFTVEAIFSIFIIAESFLFDNDELKDKKIEVENRLYDIVKKYKKYLDLFTKKELDDLLEEERQFLSRSNHNIRPYITFDEYLEMMKKRVS